ncbi:hypothetical protein VU02_03285, partial [Desulfobulbus sp. N2]|nr:hypothetical protein [Desulfobulbus sp. N2]
MISACAFCIKLSRLSGSSSTKYLFDGRYVPRTFAVFPDGKIMHHLYPSKRYKYFVELEPDNLLSLMQKAQA